MLKETNMTIKIEKELYERMDDYDFKECMKYAPFKIKEVLGWEPKYKLKDGLKKTYDWICTQMKG